MSPPRRRRRSPLDAEIIRDAGIELAATSVGEPFSVRQLGHELGVDPTALYRHYRDRNDLMRAMVDELLGRANETVDPQADWRTRVVTSAQSIVAVMAAHPSIGVEAGMSSTDGPHERAGIEGLLLALRDAGLGDDDIVRYYGVLGGAVLSWAGMAAAARLADPTAGSGSRWVPHLRIVDGATQPETARHADRLLALTAGDVMMTSLDIILDSIERAASR